MLYSCCCPVVFTRPKMMLLFICVYFCMYVIYVKKILIDNVDEDDDMTKAVKTKLIFCLVIYVKILF